MVGAPNETPRMLNFERYSPSRSGPAPPSMTSRLLGGICEARLSLCLPAGYRRGSRLDGSGGLHRSSRAGDGARISRACSSGSTDTIAHARRANQQQCMTRSPCKPLLESESAAIRSSRMERAPEYVRAQRRSHPQW